MRDGVDKSEEGLHSSERLWNRVRSRTSGELLSPIVLHMLFCVWDWRDGLSESESGEDLSSDYHDLAIAVQGLGFLESGITDPLNHFSNTLLDFSALMRQVVSVYPYYLL